MNERKHYIDNIRWATVVLVIIYHVFYIFNSVGVISNITVKGIPQMDVLLYFVYPWFMALLFVVGGMSARYSLEHRSGKVFAKERVKRLLVPSIAGVFILGWIGGWVTNQFTGMFAGNGDLIPGFVKYFGENYTLQIVLRSFFTNFYAWIMILAVIGCFKSWGYKENEFSRYMAERNFGFYVLHYPLLSMMAHLVTTYLSLPMFLKYVVILVLEIILLPIVYEVISRIPVLRFLLLGKKGFR